MSRDCRSTTMCVKCKGRHHVSLCPSSNTEDKPPQPAPDLSQVPQSSPHGQSSNPKSITNMYVSSQTPVLLQTAKVFLHNHHNEDKPRIAVRLVMDSGSQRTFLTNRARRALKLNSLTAESLSIKTFGTATDTDSECEVVEFGLETNDGDPLTVTALVVPRICHPLSQQPILQSQEQYAHLANLTLADTAEACDSLEIDLLIGADCYWKLVSGRIVRGRIGPTAIHTRVGWVLSGPVQHSPVSVNLTFCSAHALLIEASPELLNLDKQLNRFWELESLGVTEKDSPVAEKFSQQITFNGERYSVALPWKEDHPPLPDHLELCRKRLKGLLKRLRQNPPLLKDYNSVINEQVVNGIVEVVDNSVSSTDRTHYLPHHCVVRQNKSTTKVRVVYDASAKTDGPSLNDCLYVGPKSGQSVFDILLRFRLHKVVLAGKLFSWSVLMRVTGMPCVSCGRLTQKTAIPK